MTDEQDKAYARAFAQRLTAARTVKGLSKTQLAEAIASSASQVSRWEAGLQLPRVNWVARLACALGCGIAELAPEAFAQPAPGGSADDAPLPETPYPGTTEDHAEESSENDPGPRT